MTTFGEVSWSDDVFPGDKKQTNNKDLWLRLGAGSNEIRILTQPHQYYVHRYKKDGDTGFGQKVSCSGVHGFCPLCAKGDKAKPRWLLGVISRADNTYKILDISYAVFSQIRKLNKNPKFGDPTKYDINIEVDKNGGATGYYSVQAYSKEPLSAADQALKDQKLDLEELKRKVTPLTPENVQKRIDKINGETTHSSPVTTGNPNTVSTVSMTDDATMEESFPAYDGDNA